ncbi:DUF3703 domain-containing protein [Sphingobacterium faecium]|uniref:DUF3703 domain-containing protein n=1 Tax=Sphingobacterium faecium TaxID=34087 RepID=UPI003208861B
MININMPYRLKPFYQYELNQYDINLKKRDYPSAWKHLERAHILGQRYPFTHNNVHWKMLKFGIKIKNIKEIFGQIPRLIFGGVKSFVGTVPIGNPGGANVPPLKSFPIDSDLKRFFEIAKVKL